MNLDIIIRGNWLRIWQRLPGFKYKFGNYIPREFKQKNNPKIPTHIGIDGLAIGATGFTLDQCSSGIYQANLIYYDTWGNIRKKNFSN